MVAHHFIQVGDDFRRHSGLCPAFTFRLHVRSHSSYSLHSCDGALVSVRFACSVWAALHHWPVGFPGSWGRIFICRIWGLDWVFDMARLHSLFVDWSLDWFTDWLLCWQTSDSSSLTNCCRQRGMAVPVPLRG